jgi:hypothetical protein
MTQSNATAESPKLPIQPSGKATNALLACGVLAGPWATYSAATAVALLCLTWWPGTAGISVRLALAIVVAFAWVSALATELIRESSTDKPEILREK